MTLKGVKDNLVNEKHLLDNKQANKLVINSALFITLYGFATSIAVASILDVRVGLLSLLLFAFMFIMVLDACCDDSNFLNKWLKTSNFWWTGIIVIVLVFVTLKLFNFL